jgi:hypothetical protein
MQYDIAAGVDNPTLNMLASQLYTTLYPNIFKNTFNIGSGGLVSVVMDINQSPTVYIAQSEQAHEFITRHITQDNHLTALSQSSQQALIDKFTQGSFDVKLPSVALSVVSQPDGQPQQTTLLVAAVNATASISTQVVAKVNSLTITINTATLVAVPPYDTPGYAALIALLNGLFVPVLVDYLNKSLLKDIIIPALEFESIVVSMPVPVVQNPFLVAYSALGSTQPDPGPASGWPMNCGFAAVDTNVLQQLANIPFPLGPSDSFDWDIISGQVQAQVLAPTNIMINADGSVTGSITAKASATLTIHTPWPLPNLDIGPTASATVTATFIPSVQNKALFIKANGLPAFNFDFNFEPIPDWIQYILDPLLDGLNTALNAVFGPLISNIIPPIEVYTIPDISFSIEGTNVNININDATTSRGGPDNNLLLVRANLSLSS